MTLSFNIDGKEDIERFISILNLGVIEAVKNNSFSMQEATNYFFSPYTAQVLEEIGVGERLIDLIFLGCELEDVERLVPDKFNKSLENLKNKTVELLKDTPKVQLPTQYWLEE